MSPARKPKEPRKLVQVLDHNGDHEVILRVSKRTRVFILLCLLALIFGGTGTTISGIAETFRLAAELGLFP